MIAFCVSGAYGILVIITIIVIMQLLFVTLCIVC